MRNCFGGGPIRLLSVVGIGALVGFGVPGLHTMLGSHASTHRQMPADDLTPFLAQATKAINARHSADLKPLMGDGVADGFAWVAGAHETWEGTALPVDGPNGTQETLAVFHAWHSCQSDGDHVLRLIHAPQGWRFGPEIPEAETLGLRVRDHDLHVNLDIPAKNATVSDTIQVERTAESPPAFALLRISQDYHVVAITLGDSESKKAVWFRQAGGVIAFTPPTDRKFALTLRYRGHVDNKESDYIRSNEALLCSYWYPHIARLPATTTVTATAPPNWTAIAQGEQKSETKSADGATTVTFRNEIPNCFYTLDVGRYTITKRVVNDRTLSVYQLEPNAALAESCLNTLQAAIGYYDRNFAPFPFTRYAIVATQGDFSGALEAYSFATFGPHSLPELIPHELAHTWWGGMVPCTYTHSMWDEAFAEYSDDLFHRFQRPPRTPPNYPDPAALLVYRRKTAIEYGALPTGQAFDTENDRHIAAGYDKGRQVLKMLEAQLTQPTMLRCMRRFFADHPKGEAADWPEFEAAVRKETGTDYGWFFSEWLERKGVPAVALSHTTVHKEGGVYLVETDVVQTGQPYRLQLPILLETTAGEALPTTREIEGASTHLRFRIASAPKRLRLDPGGDVLFAPPVGGPNSSNPTLYTFTP